MSKRPGPCGAHGPIEVWPSDTRSLGAHQQRGGAAGTGACMWAIRSDAQEGMSTNRYGAASGLGAGLDRHVQVSGLKGRRRQW